MKIELWGRGGEIAIGSITREQYVYWKLRADDDDDDDTISQELQGDLDDDEDIPDEMRLGAWYDLDDLARETGPELDWAGITVKSDSDEILWEGELTELIKQDGLEELAEETDEFYFSECGKPYAIMVVDAQKGLFEEYTVEGTNEWDPKLFTAEYADIEGNCIITNIKYAGKDLEGNGMLDTSSKSWDWEFLVNAEDEDTEEDSDDQVE
jgi:hypothetical protein